MSFRLVYLLTRNQNDTIRCEKPELLLGKRYNEDVDTFSFGAVLYEIAVRNIPYGEEIAEFKKQKRAGGSKKIMREVAHGERKPTLDGRAECRKYRVGGSFKKRALFTICTVVLFVLYPTNRN